MDIATSTATTSRADSQPTTPPPEESASDAISSDFETFLQLLTAQLQNQDPLNPLESQDFAVQLATFSGVEQQVKTNDLLKSLGGSLGVSGLSQLAGWVGMEARVTGKATFDGAPITLAPEPASGADSAVLVVRNAMGREVSREPFPLNSGSIDWVGVGSDNRLLPYDDYEFVLESYSDGTILDTQPVAHFARVTEARIEGEDVMLHLDGGRSIASHEVTGLRLPPGD